MHARASDAGGTPVAATESLGGAGNGVGAGAAGGAGGCDSRAARRRWRLSWDLVGSVDVASAAKTLRSFGTGTDLPLKGPDFYREAENRLFCRPRGVGNKKSGI